MSSHVREDDFCLGCHWEAFHIDGGSSLDNSDSQNQWNCSADNHHDPLANCDVDEACCDVDDCSFNCSSICDGFVNCDESTVCSVPHCENENCEDDNCEDNCEDTGPACFDGHCYGDDDNCDLGQLLGFETSLNLENSNILSHTEPSQSQIGQPGKAMATGHMGPTSGASSSNCFFPPYAVPANQCSPHGPYHPGCHDLASSYPAPNGVNPADVFHMLGMCTDLSNCRVPHVPQGSGHCGHHPVGFNGNPCSLPPACFHAGHHHMHNYAKPSVNVAARNVNNNSSLLKGACRTHHHRCRSHAHQHLHHPYSPASRQSRSSVSSQLISSPGTTPPPLEDGKPSSLLTRSPDVSSDAHDSHVCKWTANLQGARTICGAVFSDEGALQEHLVSKHMVAVDGAKGNGYYCRWEGCHRPDEPFSQKSKLQGHFLTHSNHKNFKCFVCGKVFARQATLDRHARSHRGEKPYCCNVCGKSFTDSSELKTHTRTHTGEKPFKCNYPGCNFETGDSSNMSSHRLTHGERRHKCEYPGCDKSFTRPDQLKRHQRTTHKTDDSSTFPSPMPDQFPLPSFPGMA